ncbi:putative oxidoreductase YvaA [Bremerella volcania]|uniref:Putative oxidoreductase YvaA n=1 Tax=Bremerella volcania TaxID=2527984 RepID=A0A518C9G2_9BACT|nr:Gfo/Idh/MocA family oxidoreductase [Bremerella volcania]QDU75834.1 putative oxidoreductase YvaA [Bremerella volcania]
MTFKTTRRIFLKTAGAATTLALPTIIPAHVLAAPGRTGANGKIRVGLIGAGNRAKWLTRALSREGSRAELVSVCDCYLPQVDLLANEHRQNIKADPKWNVYQNYEDLLASDDLDAVIIATPDHARVRAAVLACQHGLDIYAEKPLSYTIPEGRALVKAVRKHDRILQVGTQQRSTAINLYACKFVREGGLGKVHTILVKNMPGSRPADGLEMQAIPEGMNWDRFCAQAPLMPYNVDLHRRWRKYDPFTGGTICDRGAHALDMVHLAMGWENVAPKRIEPTLAADNYWERGVRLYYPDGTVIRLESDGGPAFGGIFIGDKAKMEINRGRFACNPKGLLPAFEGQDTESHVANWLDCVQSREEPNAPVEVGHLVTSVSHLINICRIVGRPIDWDAATEQIAGDPEANKLLDKVRRPQFALPQV